MGSDPAALHIPVLLAEVLVALRPTAGMRVLDCTLGMGGHALALAQAGAVVIGVDRDGQARGLAHERFVRAGLGERLTVISATFADAVEGLVQQGQRFDAVLADLGVSSLQLDDAERGFSWRADTAPDMRMGDGCPETALELIARLDDDELAEEGVGQLHVQRQDEADRAAGLAHPAQDLAMLSIYDLQRRGQVAHAADVDDVS